MGPNAKKRTRKQYVKYRMRVLKELGIDQPSEEVVQKMLDESLYSDIMVDNVFLGCIKRAPDNED